MEYALRLGAGFGSQISMMLLRWVKTQDGVRRTPNALGYCLSHRRPSGVERLAEPRWPDMPAAELEVVQRTLRVHDNGPQARVAPTVRESKSVVAPVAVTVTPSAGLGCRL